MENYRIPKVCLDITMPWSFRFETWAQSLERRHYRNRAFVWKKTATNRLR